MDAGHAQCSSGKGSLMDIFREDRSLEPLDLELESSLAGLPLSDEGNARRFVARHPQSLRYCKTEGTWVARVDGKWERVGLGELALRVIEVVEGMSGEIAALGDHALRESLANWQTTSRGQERLKAMVRLAKIEPAVQISTEQIGLNKRVRRVKPRRRRRA